MLTWIPRSSEALSSKIRVRKRSAPNRSLAAARIVEVLPEMFGKLLPDTNLLNESSFVQLENLIQMVEMN